MQEFQGKQLTEAELIDIVRRAPKEIEDSHTYKSFMGSLAELVADYFGGERGHVTEPDELPVMNIVYVCDNCEKVHEFPEQVISLRQVADLGERLDVGSEVPFGECRHCGGLVYRKNVLAAPEMMEWMCGFEHNECVPSDGGVFAQYDTDISWVTIEEDEVPT